MTGAGYWRHRWTAWPARHDRARRRPLGRLLAALLLSLLLSPLAAPGGVPAASAQDQSVGPVTGRPLPRFASLASARVNARAGPGVEYPIRWEYHRQYLPVLIVAESQNWRKIRDQEGDEAWVHHALLSGRRSFLVAGRIATLLEEPHRSAAALLRAEPGVMGELEGCDDSWCRVVLADRRGYLPRGQVWGVAPDE